MDVRVPVPQRARSTVRTPGPVVALLVAVPPQVAQREGPAGDPAAVAVRPPRVRAVAEGRGEERVVGVVPRRVDPAVRRVGRHLQEVRRVALLRLPDEVERGALDEPTRVRAVLLAPRRRARRRGVVADLGPAVDQLAAPEVPAVVGREEHDVEHVPARDGRRHLPARAVVVLVEVLADVAGGVAGLTQAHGHRPLLVAVLDERRPATARVARVVADRDVEQHARLVRVLPGEGARPGDAAQRVDDVGVRVPRAGVAHRPGAPHRAEQLHRHVVQQHEDDVGPIVDGRRGDRRGGGRPGERERREQHGGEREEGAWPGGHGGSPVVRG